MKATITDELLGALGPSRVLTDPETLDSRRHDYWVKSQLDDMQGRPGPRPACVVRPETVEQVVAVVNACRARRTPLVPYGLGSGVCGGVVASADAVLLDMGTMRRTREIDSKNLTATFEAGVRGADAEAQVAEQGMTLGHFPQSIDVSSVGGWVATRAAGQLSTGYGNIEDLVLDLEAVLPSGEVLRTRRAPRASTGPDLRHLLLGSEGTLGVVTAVTFSLRRRAEAQVGSALYAPAMEAGFEAQREILQAGWQPVVVRQYDATEAQRMFAAQARGDDALLLLLHEGPSGRVQAEVEAVSAIARGLGCEPAPAEAVCHWLEHRNRVPTFKSLLETGVIVDTIEVSATWDRLHQVYAAAVGALREVPRLLAGSAHSSHSYRSGANLYFTFVAQPERPEEMSSVYAECWKRVMRATLDQGGSIAHHHGIGRVRREWLREELGEAGVATLRAVKRALDPAGFMNPGVLLPD